MFRFDCFYYYSEKLDLFYLLSSVFKSIIVETPYNFQKGQKMKGITMKTLLCLAVVGVALGCESVYDFGNSAKGCVFYVNYQDTTCGEFVLDKCTWNECVSYRYTSNYRKVCVRQVTLQSANWTTCTDRCCNSEVTYPQTANSIQECQAYLDEGITFLIIAIAGGIGLGVLTFVVVIVVVCCCADSNCSNKFKSCCSQCWCNCFSFIIKGFWYIFTCRCFKHPQSIEDSSNIDTVVVMKKENLDTAVKKTDGGKEDISTAATTWLLCRGKTINHTGPCSSCQSKDPSIQLQCGHVFHRLCVVLALEGNQECSICRAIDFSRTHIYCEKCFTWYHQSDLTNMKERLKSIQLCPQCI